MYLSELENLVELRRQPDIGQARAQRLLEELEASLDAPSPVGLRLKQKGSLLGKLFPQFLNGPEFKLPGHDKFNFFGLFPVGGLEKIFFGLWRQSVPVYSQRAIEGPVCFHLDA